MKKSLAFALVFVLVMGLMVGCGNTAADPSGATSEPAAGSSDAPASQPEPEPTDEAVTVTMMGWYDEPNMQLILDTLNQELGGEVVVEYTFVNLQQYNNVLSTQLAAGEGPDILADGASFPARIHAGNLVEITGADYLSNFNEAGLSLCSVDGKVYGVPSYGWYSGMWYNKDIFEANGLTPPTTFEELLAVCGQLATAGVTPLGYGLSDGDTAWGNLAGFLENVFYHGDGPGTQFDADFAAGRTTMDGNMNEAVNQWKTLIDEGYINESMLGISNEQALSDFIAGNTAMFQGGPWQYDTLKEGGANFGMLGHLGNDAEERWLCGGPAASYGINVNSKNQEAAAKALAAMASEPVQQATLDSNKGAFGYYIGLEPDVPEEYELVMDALTNGRVGCCWDRWGTNMPAQSMVDEAIKQMQGLIAGTVDTEGFLQAMDAKADSIRYE